MPTVPWHMMRVFNGSISRGHHSYCSLSKGAIALYGDRLSRHTPRDFYWKRDSQLGRTLQYVGQMVFWQSQDGRADNDPNYTECHFRFAGQYEDRETGLYYNRFRY
ncbi:hypothetical protein QVM86_20175 [Providencia stuartii]|nr:hypothetical protein [Providencia stuartii]